MKSKLMKIIDIKDMPNFNPIVKNGIDSVSKGDVYLHYYPEYNRSYPHCRKHGAMNKVSKDGIWRCCVASWDHCDSGCYELPRGIER